MQVLPTGATTPAMADTQASPEAQADIARLQLLRFAQFASVNGRF
jgi:hypothetical protein